MVQAPATTKLDLRLSHEAKASLQAAARLLNSSVSQFVLDSALARARDTLADRTRFDLDAGRWTAFIAALDAPATPIPSRLRRLLTEPGPFDPNQA